MSFRTIGAAITMATSTHRKLDFGVGSTPLPLSQSKSTSYIDKTFFCKIKSNAQHNN
jgi:hypothetical protein